MFYFFIFNNSSVSVLKSRICRYAFGLLPGMYFTSFISVKDNKQKIIDDTYSYAGSGYFH
jgi:hypothetical protein